ncbi:MAG: hypothetical protein IBJ11_11520 [Phycisphaerales bacterium]|nr:hypothetical protein [Phycisphaerales bacterium]
MHWTKRYLIAAIAALASVCLAPATFAQPTLRITPSVNGQPQGDYLSGWTIDLNPTNTPAGGNFTIQLIDPDLTPGVRHTIKSIRIMGGTTPRSITLDVSTAPGFPAPALDLHELSVSGSNVCVKAGIIIDLGETGILGTPMAAGPPAPNQVIQSHSFADRIFAGALTTRLEILQSPFSGCVLPEDQTVKRVTLSDGIYAWPQSPPQTPRAGVINNYGGLGTIEVVGRIFPADAAGAGWGRVRIGDGFHGFRGVRLSADAAPPVATARRPFGAGSRGRSTRGGWLEAVRRMPALPGVGMGG